MTTAAERLQLGMGICSWNVLHDGSHGLDDQIERLHDIATILDGRQLDAVSFYEVNNEETADILTERLGFSSYSFVPNGGHDSGIMIAGNHIEGFEEVTLDESENRRALIAHFAGDVVLAAGHPSHYPIKGMSMRVNQKTKLLAALAGHSRVMFAEDSNAPPWQLSRRMLEANFVSAFATSAPKTFPAEAKTADVGHTTPMLIRPIARLALKLAGGLPLDDVHVRKPHTIARAEVLPARVLKNGKPRFVSDHDGLQVTAQWADAGRTQNAASSVQPARRIPFPAYSKE